MNINKRMGMGLAAMTLLAVACLYASDLLWFKSHGISALILAIVVGMVLGNVVKSSWQQRLAPGVGFAKHHALRLGIVLYGFTPSPPRIGCLSVRTTFLFASNSSYTNEKEEAFPFTSAVSSNNPFV